MQNMLWEIYSLFYNLLLGVFFPYRKLTKELMSSVDIRNGDKILDAGCGPGFLIRKIAEKNRGKKLEISGVDFSQKMLDYAKKRCRNFSGIYFELVDLNKNLDFPKNSFDKVVCCNTLYALNSPKMAIKQFHKILKYRGYLVIANPKPQVKLEKLLKEHIRTLMVLQPIHKRIYHWFLFFSIMPIYLAVGVINRIILERGQKGEYHFLDKEELKEIYEKVGFKNIRISSTYADQDWLVRGEK